MSICNGCGGVVGRDCFNPRECEWITNEMNNDAYREAARVPQLEKQLERQQENFGYEILPYMQQIEIDEQHIVFLTDQNTQLKETLSSVLLAYSKQRKEFNIPIKPEAVLIAEKLLKTLK